MTRKDIYKSIREWLDGNKWHYECSSNSSIIYMGVALKSEINKLRVIVDVRDDFFLVYAIIGIGGANNILELMKFLTMANYGLINGNFEMDVSDGEIRYKTYVNCDGLKELPPQIVADSVLCACHTVKRYSSGIARLCMFPGQFTAESEIEKCEKWQAREKVVAQ